MESPLPCKPFSKETVALVHLIIFPSSQTTRSLVCPVCFQRCAKSNTSSAPCGHIFCNDCWMLHCVNQLKIGLASGMWPYSGWSIAILFLMENQNIYSISHFYPTSVRHEWHGYCRWNYDNIFYWQQEGLWQCKCDDDDDDVDMVMIKLSQSGRPSKIGWGII